MSDRGQVEAQIALSRKKNVIIAALLAFFFGPLGLIYVGFMSFVITGVMWLVAALLSVLTLGLGSFLIGAVHILCVIWAFFAVSSHNKQCERDALSSV